MLTVAYLKGVGRSRRGTAAIEFALIGPALILLVIGSADIAKGLILYQQVCDAAHTIPLTASNLAVQPDKSTSLSVDQVQQTLSSIYAEIPLIRRGTETGVRSVTMSSVTFVQADPKCVPSLTVACASAPNVTWSIAYTGGNAAGFQNTVRPCATLKQTSSTGGAASDLGSLRTGGVSNPTPLLVVDVHYRFTPVFFNFLTGPIDLWASGYWPVRSVAANTTIEQQYTKYDVLNQANGAGKCAGFT